MTSEPPQPSPSDRAPSYWQVRERFLELRSRWLTLIGERLENSEGQTLEYWRVEKADSVVVLPIHQNSLLLPPPSYRPGVGRSTLDFPGGRVRTGETPERAARVALQRELGVAPEAIARSFPLNQKGWAINSSFSNQKLYGFIVYLHETFQPSPSTQLYKIDPIEIERLLQDLTCLQCRAVLLEWELASRHYWKLKPIF